jgi:glutamate racemase
MNRPIGVFDSGLGGLTVVKAFLRHLPDEPIVYFGDTARVPYGTKSKETITRFSGEIIRFLKKYDVKMIVIACHTASALALDSVLPEFPGLPILGVVDPAARKAVKMSKTKRIGVIGTRSTISSGSFDRAIYGLEPDARVFSKACPLFVPLVEEGRRSGPIVDAVVREYIEPLAQEKIDALILGCTHYPILADRIREVLPEDVALIDPAEESALSAKFVLKELGLAATQSTSESERAAQLKCFVSDDAASFKRLGEVFLGQAIPYVERVLDEEFQAA